ncbi:hypothetical protein [Lacticaseibacillus parakribbianus]|uniref:hypothetical protein n=1 Tax=Lacticaseibacillus parakribbianus TaxID=2970927 RepID=UPI0021CAFAD3|nr:hypothetical protein [Lacticaseibacillus parakribbianus]
MEDFKDQLTFLKSIPDPIEKLLTFKFKSDFTDFDVDVSQSVMGLLQQDYLFLRPLRLSLQPGATAKYQLIEPSGDWWRGDILHSFWTTFRQSLIIELSRETFEEFCSEAHIKTLGDGITDHFREFPLPSEVWQLLESFAEVNHTIGNILPEFGLSRHNISYGHRMHSINTGRMYLTRDYADLFLHAIDEYFKYNCIVLQQMYGMSFRTVTAWLDHFEGWEDFVVQNRLSAMIDSNGKPKELFPMHFERFDQMIESPDRDFSTISISVLPQSHDELMLCLENMISQIEQRDKEIRQL